MVTVRQARPDDHEAVAEFTRDTWPERGGDYVPDVFPKWVAGDGPDQRTFVAVDGDPVGVCQSVLVSGHEAWAQGMRVAPDHRDAGVGRRLNDAVFDWAADRGATVCRNMVFDWNPPGMAASRAFGYDPGPALRAVHPEPDPDPGYDPGGFEVVADPDAAWTCWTRSDARDHLSGLAMDIDESWAVAELTRDRLVRTADETALFAVRDDRTRAVGYRVRKCDRETDNGTTRWAEYGLGAWHDPAAARALLAALARDAAAVDAERTRVFVPEATRPISDAAGAGVEVGERAMFIFEADLTGR
ncbi:GNAT family N-acetyltransferase [Halobacteriales archaeon QS_1_68_17]|nr:MAG: GNAT family N-acetyltransferase [Halobacteriales archaeon QS_1_68_17]